MKKKIIITGALGYIGTELCKLYSGLSWNSEIVAIDNRFVSERVSQLKNWRIRFFQGDILDKQFISKLINEADIVHHLAGITDVAYVKKDSDKFQDEKIKNVAIEGTSNILESMSSNAKIIFPSTHVIFEGLKKQKENISEEESPQTFLVYSSSKFFNENQIKESGKNYIILRLGSVYGYSTDTMRLGIMPNLFSKIAAQNGKIKLYAKGSQIKSLVPLLDVARCFLFMEENEKFSFQTYNLSKDSVTVKKVSEICKKINPKVIIEETNDEIPNLGYTLSNKKLLSTGFKFLYDLETSIEEMITKWSLKNSSEDMEYIKKGEKEFVDERGKISNYELPEPVNLVGYIESKKGTIRANHYHPVQEQKCLLIKGQYISIYKNLLNDNSQKITHVVNEGDLIVTKPNVAHTMVFSENSIFLNLVRGEREHENFGITHTLPFKLVDNQQKDLLIKSYKFECRSCKNKNLKRVISLGYQPLANNLLENIGQNCELYPLEMNFCENCYNCQLSVVVDPKKMFSNYLYHSSTAASFRNHFKIAAEKYIKEFNLDPKNSYIIDIGSNDGIALLPFKKEGFTKLLGIEPAKNLSDLANQNQIKTFNGFLNKENLNQIEKKADLILASNVFAHCDDLRGMAECMLELLTDDGNIIIEVQYLLKTLTDLTFDNIYHEHTNYWSLTSLQNFFKNLKCKIYKADIIDTHGGSLRVYLSKKMNITVDSSIGALLKKEEEFGMKNFITYKNFGKKIESLKENVSKNISILKKKHQKIIAYGAPAKATTALNYFNISKEIDFIIEDSKAKHGKYLPGVNIPIVGKDNISEKFSCVLVLAWNFYNEIKSKNKNISDNFVNIKDLEE